MDGTPYVHALRFRWLNRCYDPAVRVLTREKLFRRIMLKTVRPVPSERILDLGCGSGTLVRMLKSAQPEARIHGLDGDENMLALATRKARAAGLPVEWHLGDARNLPFADESFDQVCSSLFFHHLDHAGKLAALAEVLRVLRPGGRLTVADWGQAANPLQWLASWPVRWFDGLAVTRDNFTGTLPRMVVASGFAETAELAVVQTPVGTLRVFATTAPGQADV